MKNKKIIYLISSLDKGGAESHLASLADQIKKKNYQVLIIYFKGKGYWKNLLKKKIKVRKINVNNFFDFVFKFFYLKKIVEIYNPSIIHCNLSLAEIYGYLLSLFCRKKFKFIITKHLDSFFFEASAGVDKFFKGIFLEKIILKKANKVIFISKAVQKYFLSKIFLNKKKYSLIYYGLDKNRYKKYSIKDKNDLRKKLNLTSQDLILGTVARHVKQKSLDFLIKAFNEAYKKNSKLKLIIVGKGPLTKSLKDSSKKLKIKNKIIWIPYFENISLIIDLFDISCLVSKYEGLGLFLLESLLLKKPILGSFRGAIPEVVKNNFNGFLIQPNNTISFVEKVKLLEDFKLRKKLGESGHTLLSSKFNLKKMVFKFLKIYE